MNNWGEDMESNTKEEMIPQNAKPKKLTKVGLISIIASSALVVIAVVTTLVLCLSTRTVFLHIDGNVIEYSIKLNASFSEPTDLPLAEGELVLGYFKDEEFTTRFNFDTKIKENTHIFVQTQQLPKQTINLYANIDNTDTVLETVYKYENTALELPDMSDYERAGYAFSGWAKNFNGNQYDLIEGDGLYFTNETRIDLYAVWTPVKYKITFDTSVDYTTKRQDGSTVEIKKNSEPVLFGEYTINDEITLPSASKSDSSFLGWTITQETSPSSWANYVDKNSLSLGKGHYGDISIILKYETNAIRLIFEVDDERKGLFTETEYEYLVSPQSEADYVYCFKNNGFNMAFKVVNGEKYYVFREDPTDSTSNYVAPYISGMGDSNRYWQGLNMNGSTITKINANGGTNIQHFTIQDNSVTFNPVWMALKITLQIIDPITQQNVSTKFTDWGLSTKNISCEYGKTYTDFLPTPVDNENNSEFDGWYIEQTGGEKIETYKWTDISVKKLSLYTHWKSN